MANKLYLGKYPIISGKSILRKYALTHAELYLLCATGKLKPLPISNLYFNNISVEKYFNNQVKENPPLIINSADLISKYGLTRSEFAQLLQDKILTPISFTNEQNLWFEYSVACALLNVIKNK